MTEEEKILREQSWSYFALVAQQRLSVINFYFLIATGLSAGMVSLYKDNSTPNLTLVGVLGVLLISLSLIFWLWDRRHKVFVDNAVNVLEKYAEKDISNNIKLRFPLTERKVDPPDFISVSVWPDFSNCLMYLYFLFLTIGAFGVFLTICHGLDEIKIFWWVPTFAGCVSGYIFLFLRIRRDAISKKDIKLGYWVFVVLVVAVASIVFLMKDSQDFWFQNYWFFPLLLSISIALFVFGFLEKVKKCLEKVKKWLKFSS